MAASLFILSYLTHTPYKRLSILSKSVLESGLVNDTSSRS